MRIDCNRCSEDIDEEAATSFVFDWTTGEVLKICDDCRQTLLRFGWEEDQRLMQDKS